MNNYFLNLNLANAAGNGSMIGFVTHRPGYVWRVTHIRFNLATDATVASRAPRAAIGLSDGQLFPLTDVVASAALGQSASLEFWWLAALNLPQPANSLANFRMPQLASVWMEEPGQVSVAVLNGAAGDTLTFGKAMIEFAKLGT